MGELGRGDGRRHRHLFPPQTTAGLASLADFFSRHQFFSRFPLCGAWSQASKNGSKITMFAWSYMVARFAFILTSTRIFCLNDET